ncbi:MAG: tetratricopeptide repeat protein [Gemmatimonadota bacterium]|nr:MAG: tetratricopeptide repeat protein [Gemmatimonadota bacterium]
MRLIGFPTLVSVALSGCALKGDVRRVEQEVQQLRAEMARADSARADFLEITFQQIIALQRQVIDSLDAQDRRLTLFRGTVRSDLTEVQRQLMQIQELSGQSQARLAELQRRLDARESPLVAAGPPGADSAGVAAPAGAPGPEEIYETAIAQLDRGSRQTARMAFRLLIDQYPGHRLVPDAQFHIGESWEGIDPDSAATAYARVAEGHSESPRAPTALYRLGLIAEQKGDLERARVYYERVVTGYPQSDAAELARAKLNPSR